MTCAMQETPASIPGCAIAVMAKASIPGRAKTRLVPPLSEQEAADLNTAFLCDAAENILEAARFANICGFMAYAPAGSAPFFRKHLPAAIGLVETTAPDFGRCLLHAADTVLNMQYQSVCLLNSDSPTLPTGFLITAAMVLAAPGDRIVLGPSTDGGYYLIGIKQPHPQLFQGIDWSTERVFRQTKSKVEEIGVPLFELPEWYDVDDAAALECLGRELIQHKPFRTCGAVSTPARSTRRYLAELFEKADLAARLRLPSSRVA